MTENRKPSFLYIKFTIHQSKDCQIYKNENIRNCYITKIPNVNKVKTNKWGETVEAYITD